MMGGKSRKDREDYVPFSNYIHRDLLHRMRVLAVKRGTTIQDLFNAWVRAGLDQGEKGDRHAR